MAVTIREEFLAPYKVQDRDKGAIILKMFAPGAVIDGNTDQIIQKPRIIKYDPMQFGQICANLNGYMVFAVVHVPAKLPQGIKIQIPDVVIHPLAKNNKELIPAKYRESKPEAAKDDAKKS